MNPIFSNLVSNVNKVFPIASTAELCVFQAIMLCLTVALVVYLCKVAKKKAIVVDRKLQVGAIYRTRIDSWVVRHRLAPPYYKMWSTY